MYVGSQHYVGFASDFAPELPTASFFQGAWYSVTILAILGTHEMGHYLACRYYGVDASLPYFHPRPTVLLYRHVRRGHPDPSACPDQADVVRYRGRRVRSPDSSSSCRRCFWDLQPLPRRPDAR